MFFSSKKILTYYILLFFSINCQAVFADNYSGSKKNLNLIKSIKSNSDKYISNRSILWVEKEYLSESEALQLHHKIDKAIVDVETFTGIDFDKAAYNKDKIEHFVYSKWEASHTITGYKPRKHMHPVIFLTHSAEKMAPYVHELVHIIAWDWNALWIKEGLAVYLNDKLNGYPSYPNYGRDIDKVAKSKLHFKSALKKVGTNGVPKFSNHKERRVFYALAGSFVKYLDTHIGIKQLMDIYRAKNTKQATLKITGKALASWKKEWVSYLSN